MEKIELKKNTHSNKHKTNIFIVSLVLSIITARILVYLFFIEKKEVLRSITGLSFHHFHYGILLLMLSVFFMLFFKETILIIIISGIGNGLIIDSFIPSLLLSTNRQSEIIAYNNGIFPTIILLLVIISIILFKNKIFNKQT